MCVCYKLSAGQTQGCGALAHSRCPPVIGSILPTSLVPGHWVSAWHCIWGGTCDLWPNGDLSINGDVSNPEADYAILLLRRVREVFFSHSQRSPLDIKSTEVDLAGKLSSVTSVMVFQNQILPQRVPRHHQVWPLLPLRLGSDLLVVRGEWQFWFSPLPPALRGGVVGWWGKRTRGSRWYPDWQVRSWVIGDWLFW